MNHQKSFRIILDGNISKISDKALQSSEELLDCTVHLLPCHIHWNGPANVSKYFNVRSTSDPSTYYSTFRGRGLKGRLFVLPPTYEGVVYDTENNELIMPEQLSGSNAEDNETDLEINEPMKKWNRIGTFSSFNIWEHQYFDENVQKNPIRALEEWIDLANILHSSTEDIDDAQKDTP